MSLRHDHTRKVSNIRALPSEWQLKQRLRRLSATLLMLLCFHVAAMVVLEDMSLRSAVWLTLTTLTTVGYGDLSASTPLGQLATIALMYITAITLVTLIISDYIDYRFYRREYIRAGRWRWNMINHILIINSPKEGGERYYMRLVQQVRAHSDYRATPIQILTTAFPNGLPPELSELGVVHYHGRGNDVHDLAAVNVQDAKHIIILASDSHDINSDSLSFDILHRLNEFKLADRAVVECVQDENRERLNRLKPKAIIRPVRTYPEIIVRALLAPGAEKVLEDLFTHENDHPHRYDVSIQDMPWQDIVCALMQAGFGTAMAYVEPTGEVIVHPPGMQEIDAKALIVLVKTEDAPSEKDVQEAIIHYQERQKAWEVMRTKLEQDAS